MGSGGMDPAVIHDNDLICIHNRCDPLGNNDLCNVRISGKYEVKPDEKGRMHYILENGTDIQESDGICLFVGKDAVPDYRIISIKSYRMLSLEVEKL